MADTGTQRSAAIRTPDQRLRVFVSSSLVEVSPEREAARAAIEQLRLAPVMFESGARPHPAQALYRAYLAQSDVFIGIYAESYGWVGPGMTVSGLEEELQLAAGLPRLLYVKTPVPDRDPALGKMLDQIKASGEAAYKKFSDPTQLQELILTDLATLLAERFDEPRRDIENDGQSMVPPEPMTTLVGRDDDINRIVGLLGSSDRRLVVLTGPGGIGKTRLALAVMERSAGQWRDGVAFVDLSAITDARLVPDVIAAALGLVGQGRERPQDALRRRLSERTMLIVLDNFEQVLDATPIVADLLQHSPHLHVLVTSRVVMRVRGEQEWRVEALSVPPANADFAELAQAPALRLFVDRVRDVQAGFELTNENAPALAELCRRLGGLPLALELAAGWMRLLTPEQMLTQLYGRLEQPGSLVDLPDRQQTLTQTISWSYDLLPASAQLLLTRLSVFADPFTVDGVIAVCGTHDADVIEDLSTLLDSSMVSPSERTDRQRGFQLLDPIRRFAAERLEKPDDTLSRLHQYVLEVLMAANVRLGSQDLLMRRLDSEELNLQVVIEWIGRNGQESGPLISALGDVWVWMLACGHLRETSDLWQQIQSLQPSGLRTERDRLALQWLTANRLLNDGAYAEAGTLIDEMMPVARRIETPARIALLLTARAIVRPYGAREQARANSEEALAVARDAGDALVLGYALSHCALLLCVNGEPTLAQERHRETLDIGRSLNDENLRAEAHYGLALDAILLDDHASAQSHLAAAIDGYHGFDHLDGLTRCIAALSELALQRDDSHLAARLIGAAAAARDNIGLTPWPSVTEVERRTSDGVRSLVVGDEFSALVESGRSIPIEDALAEAQVLLGPTPATRT